MLGTLGQSTADPTGGLAQFVQAGGTAAAIVLLVYGITAFVRGWVVPGSTHRADVAAKDAEIDKLEAKVAAKDAELAETRDFIRDGMMPLLTRTQDVLGKTLEERAWQDRSRYRDQQ